MTLTLPPKHLAEELNYLITLTGPGYVNEMIQSAMVTSDMDTLVIDRVTHDNNATVRWWMQGGTVNKQAIVTVTVVTVFGLTIETDIQMRIIP